MPDKISVLTLVHDRPLHLKNMLLGLMQSQKLPDELVIIYMNEDKRYTLPQVPFPVIEKHIRSETSPIPLAAARNLGATAASGDYLIFLDVDCIPEPHLVSTYSHALRHFDGLLMGDIHYLPQSFDKQTWSFQQLRALAVAHPRRPVLTQDGLYPSTAYELFWTLNFALRSTTFSLLSGFDEQYCGYGAEDTDFAFTARQQGIPFALCRARTYHQPHAVYKPPLQHFTDIISNARRFKDKWQIWPMDGWLQQFADLGLISWKKTEKIIEIRRQPTPEEIEQARHQSPAGF